MKSIDLNNYQRQGNLAIDMVAACIIHERKFNMPIKAVVLNSAYFDMLKAWVKKTYGEQTAEKEFYLDTIEIRKEKIFSGKSLMVEYYKTD
ncbi:MAG TPA: hypothetical protein VN722_08485 [Hanamia sp.]|nr:hypothetical protein [Hanamia sp.]